MSRVREKSTIFVHYGGEGRGEVCQSFMVGLSTTTWSNFGGLEEMEQMGVQREKQRDIVNASNPFLGPRSLLLFPAIPYTDFQVDQIRSHPILL